MPLDPLIANGLNTVYGLSHFSFSHDLKKKFETTIDKQQKTPTVPLTAESLAQIQTHALIAHLASEKAKNSRIATWIFLSVTIAAVALAILAPMVMIPLAAVLGVLTILASAKTIKDGIEKNKALTNLARLTFKHLPELAQSQENPFELLFQKNGKTTLTPSSLNTTTPIASPRVQTTPTGTVNQPPRFSQRLVIGIIIKLFSTHAIQTTNREINQFLPIMTRFLETGNPDGAQESLNQIICHQYVTDYPYITNNILLNALYFITTNDLQDIEPSQNNINRLVDETFGGYFGLPATAIQSIDRLIQSIRSNNPTTPQVLHYQILAIYKSTFENSLVRSSQTRDVSLESILQLFREGFNPFNTPANAPFINQEISQMARVFFDEIVSNPPNARESPTSVQSDTPLPEGTPLAENNFSLRFEERYTPELQAISDRNFTVQQRLLPAFQVILAHHQIQLESEEIIPTLVESYQGRYDCPSESCNALNEITNDPYMTNNIICNLFHFVRDSNINIQDFMRSGYIEFTNPIKDSLNQLFLAITNCLDELFPGSHHELPIHGQYQIHSLLLQIYRNFLSQDNLDLDSIDRALTQQFTTQVAPHILGRSRNFDPVPLAPSLREAARTILQEIQTHRA